MLLPHGVIRYKKHTFLDGNILQHHCSAMRGFHSAPLPAPRATLTSRNDTENTTAARIRKIRFAIRKESRDTHEKTTRIKLASLIRVDSRRLLRAAENARNEDDATFELHSAPLRRDVIDLLRRLYASLHDVFNGKS